MFKLFCSKPKPNIDQFKIMYRQAYEYLIVVHSKEPTVDEVLQYLYAKEYF